MSHENTMAGREPQHERDDGLPPVWPWDRQQDNPGRHRAFDSDDSSSTPSHAADIDAARPSKQAKMSWEVGKEYIDQEFSRKVVHGDEYESGSTEDEYLTETVVSFEGENQLTVPSGRYVSEYDIALGDLEEERNPSDLFGDLPWDQPDAQVKEQFRDAIEQAEELSRYSFAPFGGPLSQEQREKAAQFFHEAPHLESNVCTCGASSCDDETARILDREAHSGPATRRDEVLTEASDLIHGDRNGAYDHPGENFRRIAVFWSEILKAKLGAEVVTEADVANMMVAVKLARNLHSNRRDNWVDMAGYAACGHEVSDYDSE